MQKRGPRAYLYGGEEPATPICSGLPANNGPFFFREGETGQVQPHQSEESWAGSPCSMAAEIQTVDSRICMRF